MAMHNYRAHRTQGLPNLAEMSDGARPTRARGFPAAEQKGGEMGSAVAKNGGEEPVAGGLKSGAAVHRGKIGEVPNGRRGIRSP